MEENKTTHLKLYHIIFWFHFVMFLLQQFDFSESTFNLVKGSIILAYSVLFLLIIGSYSKSIPLIEVIIFLIVIIAIIMKGLLINTLNIQLLYWFLVIYCVYKLNISIDDLTLLINKLAIVYFILTLLFVYTSLNQYLHFEVREGDNRFFLSMHRFIGLEGSPAGPDIFYTLVLLFNLYKYRGVKFIFTIPVVISIIIIIWTSSLSNLVGLLLTVFVYFTYKFRYIAFVLIVNGSLIISCFFNSATLQQTYFLNMITSYRAHIWFQVWNNLIKENVLKEWLFGRSGLIDFYQVGQRTLVDANPHNLYLFALQFLGLPLFAIIFFVLGKRILSMKRDFLFFITMFILIYSITSGVSLTTRGNPIIIYIFTLCLGGFKNK